MTWGTIRRLVCSLGFIGPGGGLACQGGGSGGDHPDASGAAGDAPRDLSPGARDVPDDLPDLSGVGSRPLFNGVDFSGWDRYLGKPSAAEAPLGLENDPRGVYSIVTLDGEPAIRISGEVWGSLMSREELCDFHLRLEYRWGTAVWPPLNGFDSGIMYLSTGPLGAVNVGGPGLSDPIGSGAFVVSMEYQLTKADVGGMYNLGPITFQALPRAALSDLPEAWNRVDILVQGDTAWHQLNGEDVTSGMGFSVAWPGESPRALRCGKLQLQSEGAEIFFRRLELLPLP